MRMRVMFLSCAIALSAMLAGVSTGQAQDYPTRPVTVISPAAAGNSPDVAMRIVADRHWASDVLAGAIVGSAIGAGVSWAHLHDDGKASPSLSLGAGGHSLVYGGRF